MITSNVSADTINDCQFTYEKYSCSGEPVCKQDGIYLSISFCRSEDEYVTNKIPIANIKQYSQSQTSNSVVYKDLSDLVGKGVDYATAKDMVEQADMEQTTNYKTFYTITVTFDTTMTSVSQMETYLKSLNITDGIAAVQPGRPNKPGGVVILW